jgi:hypothetical protein
MVESKTYRVILIDPVTEQITELQSDCSLDSVHALVEAEVLTHFGLAAFEDGHRDFGWMDDLGLSRGEPIHAFLLPTSKDPFAGKCLILGTDERGEYADAGIPLQILLRDIKWLGLIRPEVFWEDTDTGSRAITTYSRVKPS